jgi:hypothetical protein
MYINLSCYSRTCNVSVCKIIHPCDHLSICDVPIVLKLKVFITYLNFSSILTYDLVFRFMILVNVVIHN